MSSENPPSSIREVDHVQWQDLENIVTLPKDLLEVIVGYDKGASVICISDDPVEISDYHAEQQVHLPDSEGQFKRSTLSRLCTSRRMLTIPVHFFRNSLSDESFFGSFNREIEECRQTIHTVILGNYFLTIQSFVTR